MSNTLLKLRISLTVASAVGMIFYIAAFSLPHWSEYGTQYIGIWQICFLSGGAESCSLLPGHFKTSSLQVVQVLSSLGLVFYVLFVVSSTMTIFWTRRWKAARFIKLSTAVFAVLAAVFVSASVAIYKEDKGSDTFTVAYAWYFALISAVVAAVVAPFYFVDAYKTEPSEKPERERFFKKINIPPMPTVMKFGRKDRDTQNLGNRGRPPLLSELRRQRTNFFHPPPQLTNKKLTLKEIKSFPLPPSKTKLDLFDKSETENHPAPQMMTTVRDNNLGSLEEEIRNKDPIRPIVTPLEHDNDIEEVDINEHSVFKFINQKLFMHKGGHPMSLMEQEQFRRKFAPYFNTFRNENSKS